SILVLVMITLICIIMSPVVAFISIKSSSLFRAAFFLGIINSSTSLCIMIVAGGNSELLNGLNGLAGFIILLALNVIILLRTRGTINARYKDTFDLLKNHS